jgi:hypothetical protein
MNAKPALARPHVGTTVVATMSFEAGPSTANLPPTQTEPTRGDVTMQSNTTRAARAHSPGNGTTKTHSTRKGYAAVWKAVAAAVAAAYASSGVANVTNLPYTAPAAHVYAADGFGGSTYDFDGLLPGDLGDPLGNPRIAIATQGAASAKAESSKNVYTAKAIVAPTQFGEARATAQWLFIPHDTQGRASVTLDLKLKMTANQASLDPTTGHFGAFSYAGYSVLVCSVAGGPGYVTYDESGVLINVGEPQCGYHYYNFAAETQGPRGGTWWRQLEKFGGTVYRLEGQGADVSDVIDVGVEVIPGVQYLLMVSTLAGTSFNGGEDRGAAFAAVDPVLEPDSVNPDVTIEFPNLAVDPNPQPLMGDLTPEAFAAMGLNPQPLVDLGFFDAPSGGPHPPPPPPSGDTTPPATTESASPNANVAGWNNTPVTVTLSATDNPGGSGVKEVHYSLGGAATGSQVVSGNSATVPISAEGTTTLSYFAIDNAGNREAVKTLTVKIDLTPPATSASAMPGANVAGWNNTPVTVTLSATDNAGGSGVKEVHYSLGGAATGSQVVSGNSAAVPISAEGTTTLSYFAVDNAGNREAIKTLTVKIDLTPPTLTGLPSNCSLWPPNHRLVQVASVEAADALSGLAGPPVVTATSNEPEDGTGDGDLAPDMVISAGTVQLRAERAGNGTGRTYTITATASDLAGNTVTNTATCLVPHDM